jgi:flagellar basal-body rod protein FlgB
MKMNPTTRVFDPMVFGEAALKLRSHRHELLASNLVNADTPNYKARDIDFKEALTRRLAGLERDSSLYLSMTNARHIQIDGNPGSPESYFRVPVQPSVDGNTVDPDLERSHFVKNAMYLESTLAFLTSTIKSRLTAITGQPS